MIGIWIAAGIGAVILLLAFMKQNLRICPPNEILIFSGRRRKLDDGTSVGYRVIKGSRAFKWPIIESVHRMSLETMPIELELSGALSNGLIPLNLEAQANVKIAGSESEGLYNAVERFLGKPGENTATIARETLEGSLRGVLATLTPEEANDRRLEFARRVMEEAAEDLRRLGLVLDTFKVQTVSDDQHYLEAIGRKKNAEVQRDAKIAEARSEAEARKVSAEAKREASVAESESEQLIAEAANALRVRKAELDADGRAAESKAEVAGQIARVEREGELEEARVALNQKKYRADVVVPAVAEREAEQLKAAGHAARITEDGKATAEAIRLMRQEWENGGTRELFLLQQLPDIIDRITHVISDNLTIEKLTVLDGGHDGGGVPGLVAGLTGSVVSVLEQVENATGLNIPEILQGKSKARASAGEIENRPSG